MQKPVLVCGVVAAFLIGPAHESAVRGQGQNQTSTTSAAAPQQPLFHSTTSLVEVDAIVLDGHGQFVPGLSADDVQLFENGQPQQIQQFYMVTADAGARAATTDPMPISEDRAHRVFVLLFDEEHLATDSLLRVKKGAEEFIATQMGPNDMGGIYVNGGMYRGRLTSSRAELLAGIRSAQPAFDNRAALFKPFLDFPRIPGENDAVRIDDGDMQLSATIAQNDCSDAPQECLAAGGVGEVESAVERKAKFFITQSEELTSHTLQSLTRVATGLARMPGRKTVVFLSEGFFVEESRASLTYIAGLAARGDTAIYSIDGRGLGGANRFALDLTTTSMSRDTTFDTGDDGPSILAQSTGGFVVRNIDDMSRALNLIARDTSTYYVIGYQPTVPMDGKYRKISVRTKEKGMSVRARQGYVASALATGKDN